MTQNQSKAGGFRKSGFTMLCVSACLISISYQTGVAAPGPRLASSTAPISFTEPELFIADEFIAVLNRDSRSRIQVTKDKDDKPATNLASLQTRMTTARVSNFERQFPTAKAYPVGHKFPDLTGYYVVKIEAGADLKTAMDELRADPHVEHVEKIGVHRTNNNPNDSFFLGSQWNMKANFGINGPPAWKIQNGDPSVIIGILDTGVRYFHRDLGGDVAPWSPAAPQNVGNIFINTGEIPANGIDEDTNGRIDDVVGYDFLASSTVAGCTCNDLDCNTIDNEPDDFNGHGTHVSGIAAAITNNGRGVAGTAGGFGTGLVTTVGDGARIMPLRVGWNTSNCGGLISMAAAATAMNYVATMVDDGYNITAINCSWGSSNTGGLGAALTAVLARDVMVVKAAGNDNSSAPDFLGSQAAVVAVAGTAQNGTGYTSSNFGPWVDIAAPAVNVTSTIRNSADPNPANDYYASLTGTSMAAPHVCGVAALLESCRPDLTSADKIAIMQQTSIAYIDVRDLGDGIVNARNAVQEVCLENVKFSQPLSGVGEDIASNLDTSDLGPNIVHADDFVSDGRPITSVEWWGSQTPAFPVFRVDDGGAENSVGVNEGGTIGGTFGWANRFTNTSGGPLNITSIEVAFGAGVGSTGVTVGDAVDAVIWIDAGATANMNNATPVLRWSLPGGVHANDGTFGTFAVPGGVIVPSGADFYVGCGDIQTQNDAVVRFPASIDEGPPLAVRSWAFFPANITDPFSENLAGQTVGTIDSFGLPGNWLIRAGGDPAPTPDGWFLSFHEHPLPTGASLPEQALGLYYCDESIVERSNVNVASCDGHPVLEYRANIEDCCLVHSEVDSRSGATPAQAAEFQEESCFAYAIDIQAVIGTEYSGAGCTASSTGRSADANFWGWHSTDIAIGGSFGLQSAQQSQTGMSGSDWLYGPWAAASPACSDPNMAFRLFTTSLISIDPDINDNGIPDACEAPDAVVANGAAKTRFISFDIPSAVTAGPPAMTALRVKLTDLHHVGYCDGGTNDNGACTTNAQCPPGPPSANCLVPYPGTTPGTLAFTAFEGQSVYAGEPQTFCEKGSVAAANCVNPFLASITQCAPHYRDWSTVGLLHVHGSAIAPSSTYAVEHLGAACMGTEAICIAFEPGAEIKTTRWGDVEVPYNPPSTSTQPDLGDIAGLVDKFEAVATAPIKARGLQAGGDGFGTITSINVDFDFSHIAACVDAFGGEPYKGKMGKCTGAATAPFTGACTTTAECTGAGLNGTGPCVLLKVGNCTGPRASGYSGTCITNADCTAATNGAGPCILTCTP